jgi:hypothetical protein
LAFEVAFAQNVPQRKNNVAGYESLRLCGIAVSNPGCKYGRLIPEGIRRRINQKQLGQQRVGTSNRGLNACDNVADCPQSWEDDTVSIIVVQQKDEPRDDSGVNNFLDDIFRYGEVTQSHASVSENVLVVFVDEVEQGGKKLSDCRVSGVQVTTQVAKNVTDQQEQMILTMKPNETNYKMFTKF